MAVVRLSDVIEPEVFLSYGEVNSPERIAFLLSGIVRSDPTLDEAANRGGSITTLPFWNDLDSTVEPNISTDNPADESTPQGVDAGDMTVRVCDFNQSWGAMDLAGQLAGSDPMRRIRARTDMYWQRQWQHKLIASCNGIQADNKANNAGDMIYDISLPAAGAVAAANLFSRDAFTEAAFTMGDRYDDCTCIAMHSKVFQSLTSQQLIDFIQPANVPLRVPTYDDKFIVVDDGMPVVADPNNAGVNKYTTVLFGRGVIGFGNGNAKVPVEVFRYPQKGNGSGEEELYLRKRWIVHPAGFSFTSLSVAAQSPVNAELALAANWTRQVPRKNVPIAFLVTNG